VALQLVQPAQHPAVFAVILSAAEQRQRGFATQAVLLGPTFLLEAVSLRLGLGTAECPESRKRLGAQLQYQNRTRTPQDRCGSAFVCVAAPQNARDVDEKEVVGIWGRAAGNRWASEGQQHLSAITLSYGET